MLQVTLVTETLVYDVFTVGMSDMQKAPEAMSNTSLHNLYLQWP